MCQLVLGLALDRVPVGHRRLPIVIVFLGVMGGLAAFGFLGLFLGPIAGEALGTAIHTQDAEELRYVVLQKLTCCANEMSPTPSWSSEPLPAICLRRQLALDRTTQWRRKSRERTQHARQQLELQAGDRAGYHRLDQVRTGRAEGML